MKILLSFKSFGKIKKKLIKRDTATKNCLFLNKVVPFCHIQLLYFEKTILKHATKKKRHTYKFGNYNAFFSSVIEF